MPWHRAMWRVARDFPTISYSLLYRNKKQSEKDRKIKRCLGNKAVIIAKFAVWVPFPLVITSNQDEYKIG